MSQLWSSFWRRELMMPFVKGTPARPCPLLWKGGTRRSSSSYFAEGWLISTFRLEQ